MNVHALYDLAFRRFRPARLRLLYRTLAVTAETRVLDVGGSADLWRRARCEGLPLPRLTVLNLEVHPDPSLEGARWVCGDACRLPFADLAFDVAVSNSVIEHVGGWEDQKRMADEVRRVGKRYFIQTPNRWFPIEPHFLFPFFQFLPVVVRAWLLRRRKLGWMEKVADPVLARQTVESVRLLGPRQMNIDSAHV
mgnify:CR=1 FL=1